MPEFSPQMGAVSGLRNTGGWSQSKAVQAGVGGGLAAAKTREMRSQYERTFAQNQEQFNAKMGFETEKFNREQAFAEKQQKYTEKREAKAERIGMFGTAIEAGKLGLSMANEANIDLGANLESAFGFGGENTQGAASKPTATERDLGTPDSETTMGESGGGVSKGFTDTWSQWAVGGATGGMAGSFIAQGLFGKGKVQSTAGGTVGGGIGGGAATGTWQGAVGGAFVGGVLGYLLG
jgi:hypothetical protein